MKVQRWKNIMVAADITSYFLFLPQNLFSSVFLQPQRNALL